MTFDDSKDEITGWLDGVSRERWLDNPKSDGLISYACNAYMQGHYHRMPGIQPGEDAGFPADQFYNPPEDEPLEVKVIREQGNQRIEYRRYRYTKVQVTLEKKLDGEFVETDRDLVALRLNPWWYPHGIYSPPDSTSGGPFTIGRVIHSGRSGGFTGWIGGVAVFDRGLTEHELKELAALCEFE